MYCDPTAAAAFIRRQLGDYQLAGITTMTAKQAARIERLEVIRPGDKRHALKMLATVAFLNGRPPGGGGRMRVVNMNTGEIAEMRAPALARA